MSKEAISTTGAFGRALLLSKPTKLVMEVSIVSLGRSLFPFGKRYSSLLNLMGECINHSNLDFMKDIQADLARLEGTSADIPNNL